MRKLRKLTGHLGRLPGLIPVPVVAAEDCAVFQQYRSWPLSDTLNIASRDATMTGVYVSPDGVYLFCCGSTTDDVFRFTMSTPWDMTTASFDHSYSSSVLHGEMFFKPDGLVLYLAFTNEIRQIDLSVAWDLTSTLTAGGNSSIGSDAPGIPQHFHITDDGVYLFAGFNDMGRFTMSTPWDITSATYDTKITSGFGGNNEGVTVDPTGRHILMVTDSFNTIEIGYMSTAFDPSTADVVGELKYAQGSAESDPRGLHMTNNGQSIYFVGGSSDLIREFTISPQDQI